MRIHLQPAFILHARSYRETSLLLDVFTQDHGRISLIARGVRKIRSKTRALLQPFYPLLISWQGKTELMSLHIVEPNGPPYHLKKDCLLSGFYLNELLMRLVQKHDPHPELYTIYQQTLLELQTDQLEQKPLRLFEKKLLTQIGYGIQFPEKIVPEKNYRFYPEEGFTLCEEAHSNLFTGKSLLSLFNEELVDEESLKEAKRLMRMAFMPLLDSHTLQSRKLFIEVTE